MDDVIQLGPLMFSPDRLLAVGLIWLFLGLGAWIDKRTGNRVARATWIALLVGILVARAAWVADNYGAFAVEPWTIIALWQGGFNWWAGVLGAALAIILLLRRQRATGMLLASLAGLALIHLGALHMLAAPPRPLPQGIVVAHVDGRALPLDELRGQPFVLNIWATWCPPCRREMPMLVDVAGSSDVPILLVNHRESPAMIEAFLAREKLGSSAIVLDPTGALVAATGAQAFPTTLFVDAAGNIRTTHAGEISRAALTAALRNLKRNPA
ncbi:MAG: TlpA disulfide reductase family protein [Sphingomonadaceae bacterium]